MNKYNVQAIRKELEDCIRNSKWKSFRKRFQGLDPNLARAVAVHNPSKKHNKQKKTNNANNKQQSSSSLLLRHMLSYCRPHPNAIPIPMDVLEMVIQASPPNALSGGGRDTNAMNNNNNNNTSTPLNIALEHGAPINLLETLLSYDSQVLYVSDYKHGDTPLLYAIRHGLDEDIVRLFIRFDSPTRGSLLISSRKKRNNRTPLFYAANRELSYLRNEDVDLPFDLQYILLQTQMAMNYKTEKEDDEEEEQQEEDYNNANSHRHQARKVLANHNDAGDDDGENHNGGGYFENHGYYDNDDYKYYDDDHDESVDYNVSEKEHWTTLLEATIATAHLLGTKSTAKILAFLVPRALAYSAGSMTSTTLLHHVCRATEEQSFLEPNIQIMPTTMTTTTPLSAYSSCSYSSSDDATCLVDILVSHTAACTTLDDQGQLPIHVALEHHKSWELIRRIINMTTTTTTTTVNNNTNNNKNNPSKNQNGDDAADDEKVNILGIPNTKGSLPLHTALGGVVVAPYYNNNEKSSNNESDDNDNHTTERQQQQQQEQRRKIVMELWKMYPEATAVVDGATRLFSFQLVAAAGAAATKANKKATAKTSQSRQQQQQKLLLHSSKKSKKAAKSNTIGNIDNDDDDDKTTLAYLSDCYFFLRSAPQVLSQYVPVSE